MIVFWEQHPDPYFNTLFTCVNKLIPSKYVHFPVLIHSSDDICFTNGYNTSQANTHVLVITQIPSFESTATAYKHILLHADYESYKSKLETFYKTPLTVIPGLWKPLIAEKYKCKKTAYDIVVLNPTLQTLSICESIYKKQTTKLGTIYCMTAKHDSESIISKINTYTMKSKTRVFVDLETKTILGHFLKSPNSTIFLIDTPSTAINDIMYAEFPIVHNMQHLRNMYGISSYYEPSVIDSAVQRLEHIIQTDKYAITPIMLETQAILEKIQPIMHQFINLPIPSIQSDIDYKDVNKPLVIAFDNEPTENTNLFIQTLKNNKWEYALIGIGEEWKGWTTRIEAYKKVLKSIPSDKMVILSDARDVVCCRSPNAFMDAFVSLNKECNKLLASTEFVCDGYHINNYNFKSVPIQNKYLENYWKYHKIPQPLRQFVNNGLIAGRAKHLLDFYTWTETSGLVDDQLMLATYTDTFPDRVLLDVDAKVLHTSIFGHNAGMLYAPYHSYDAPTYAELAGRGAFFLHIPGKFKGQTRIYESVKTLIQSGYCDTYVREGYPYSELSWKLSQRISRPLMIHKQTLGAYYQCYKNPKSFLKTMESFQKHYPGSTIVISNDGGDDFSTYVKSVESNNVHYTYYPKTRPPSKQLAYATIEPLLDFLSRLWSAFDKIPESHIVLLEDDVRIIRRHTLPFTNTINGMNPEWELPRVMKNELIGKGYKGHFYLGGCGGCVIDKEFYKRIPYTEVESLLKRLPPIPVYASDVALVFLALYYGGSINHYEEFAEMFYPNISELLVENKVAFLHQVKHDYKNELTDDETNRLYPK